MGISRSYVSRIETKAISKLSKEIKEKVWAQGYLYLETPLLGQEKWANAHYKEKCTLKAYLAFRKHF